MSTTINIDKFVGVGFRGVVAPVSTYDPDAQAFITATALTNTTQKNIINELVLDLKAAGLWTRSYAIYPLITDKVTQVDIANQMKYNLKNPLDTNAAYRLSWVGGWTFASTGALPSSSYANTFLAPATAFAVDHNKHLSFYSRTNAATAGFSSSIGSDSGGGSPNYCRFTIRQSSNGRSSVYGGSNGTATAAAETDSRGFYLSSRTSSTASAFYKNGALIASGASTNGTTSQITQQLLIGAAFSGASVAYYDNKECSFATIGESLTELQSQIYYQIVEKYQVALGRSTSATLPFYYDRTKSNEYNAYIFATQITDATLRTAINTLIEDMKTIGVWTKVKGAYPMVTDKALQADMATQMKFNLVNPRDTNAAYRLGWVGGWTYASTGATPNGSNAYADTYIAPSTVLTLNSQHLGYYSRTSAMQAGTNYIMGSYNGGGTNAFALSLSSSGNTALSLINSTNAGSYPSLTHSNQQGFWMANRPNATANTHKLWKNGVNVGSTPTVTAGTLLGNTIWLGALPNPPLPGYFGNAQCAFATIGDGLTDTEVINYRAAVQAFNTTIGRQV